MPKIFYLLLFPFFSSITYSQKVSSKKEKQTLNNEYLPVWLSYEGVPMDTTLKNFITGYLRSKNFEIISREDGMNLIKQEITRASSGITSKGQGFYNELYQNRKPVFNGLTFNFKLSPDSSKIFMGWNVTSWPFDMRNPIPIKWNYLQTIAITDAPPGDALRALCDTIIASKNLYK